MEQNLEPRSMPRHSTPTWGFWGQSGGSVQVCRPPPKCSDISDQVIFRRRKRAGGGARGLHRSMDGCIGMKWRKNMGHRTVQNRARSCRRWRLPCALGCDELRALACVVHDSPASCGGRGQMCVSWGGWSARTRAGFDTHLGFSPSSSYR